MHYQLVECQHQLGNNTSHVKWQFFPAKFPTEITLEIGLLERHSLCQMVNEAFSCPFFPTLCFYMFPRFGKRVSRAFSFNKTPRKLKRAMSSMTQLKSPFRRDSSSFLTPQTPGSDLRGMRLASTIDLSVGTPG